MLKNQYICVEGLIGAGKTTLFKDIRHSLTIPCFQERVENWLMLSSFYQDPSNHTYMLQAEILTDYKRLRSKKRFLTERCPQVSVEVFSKMHLQAGNLTAREFQSLRYYEKTFLPKPSCIFYLEVSPDAALERIKQRSRAAEKDITLDYLVELQSFYGDWLDKNKDIVLTINGEQSPEKVKREFLERLKGVDPTLVKAMS